MPNLYPVYDAQRSYHLPVGQGHQLHIEEYGNPEGVPVLICHGGPGVGLNALNCRYFNPGNYRIILYSQRGCGLSTPHFELSQNTTEHLIADIEMIRGSLGINKWVIAGGSWGATLALIYAISYPDHVCGLILHSSFLATEQDINWLFSADGAAASFYPEHYARFSQDLTSVEEILAFYQTQLSGNNEIAKVKAAKMWCEWELILSGLYPNHLRDFQICDKQKALSVAMIENHYFVNNCFLSDHYIENNLDKIKHIKAWFIHGRQDLICSFSSIYQLAMEWNAKLDILNDVGHSSEHPVYADALRIASDTFYCSMKNRI